MREPGCRQCELVTSGDCGMHGPVLIPSGARATPTPPGDADAIKAMGAALAKADPAMFAQLWPAVAAALAARGPATDDSLHEAVSRLHAQITKTEAAEARVVALTEEGIRALAVTLLRDAATATEPREVRLNRMCAELMRWQAAALAARDREMRATIEQQNALIANYEVSMSYEGLQQLTARVATLTAALEEIKAKCDGPAFGIAARALDAR